MGIYLDAFKSLVKLNGLKMHSTQEQVATIIDAFISDHLNPSKRSWFHDPKFGVYLYGCVGSGKTMLMDLVRNVVSDQLVQRQHFLGFMQAIRSEFARSSIQQALMRCPQNSLLLLDEFQVNDIADAMILRKVLHELDNKRVKLVCTSNRHPDELYLGGIQRASFLPCIEYIKSRMHVLPLFTEDHRNQSIAKQDSHFYYPINKETEQKLLHSFSSQAASETTATLNVLGRQVVIERVRGASALLDSSWFETTGPSDYLAVCSTFTRLYILNVKKIDGRDQARRFIDFVDCAYEHRVHLTMQMECELNSLFNFSPEWKEEAFAYQRTLSRLQGMQYWSQ